MAAYYLTTTDNVRIRIAVTASGARGTVLIFPGRTEYAEKCGPVMSRLAELGFGSVAVDWRGQGLADRPGNTTGLGHVETFSDYQSDVRAVLAAVKELSLPEPHHLLAHSMGGCIGLRALLSGLPVQSAIFSAPMWDIALPRLLRPVARGLGAVGPMLGLSQKHAPGTTGDFYVSNTPFPDNLLTGDEAQYAWMREHLVKHPELGLGGPSIRWMGEALRETRNLRSSVRPSLPVLTFLGTEEAIVSGDAIRSVMADMPHGNLVILDGARHEVLIEKPAILDVIWEKIGAHLAAASVTKALI